MLLLCPGNGCNPVSAIWHFGTASGIRPVIDFLRIDCTASTMFFKAGFTSSHFLVFIRHIPLPEFYGHLGKLYHVMGKVPEIMGQV
jgi:hypothetical protein